VVTVVRCRGVVTVRSRSVVAVGVGGLSVCGGCVGGAGGTSTSAGGAGSHAGEHGGAGVCCTLGAADHFDILLLLLLFGDMLVWFGLDCEWFGWKWRFDEVLVWVCLDDGKGGEDR